MYCKSNFLILSGTFVANYHIAEGEPFLGLTRH